MSAPVEIPTHGLREVLVELIGEHSAPQSAAQSRDGLSAYAKEARVAELTRLLDLLDSARRDSPSSATVVVDAVEHGRAARLALQRAIERAEVETESATDDDDAEAVGEILWRLHEARLAHDALLAAAGKRVAPRSSTPGIEGQHDLPEGAFGPDTPGL
jgi:hypothetical protein